MANRKKNSTSVRITPDAQALVQDIARRLGVTNSTVWEIAIRNLSEQEGLVDLFRPEGESYPLHVGDRFGVVYHKGEIDINHSGIGCWRVHSFTPTSVVMMDEDGAEYHLLSYGNSSADPADDAEAQTQAWVADGEESAADLWGLE